MVYQTLDGMVGLALCTIKGSLAASIAMVAPKASTPRLRQKGQQELAMHNFRLLASRYSGKCAGVS